MKSKQNDKTAFIIYSFIIGFICIFFLWLGNFKIFQDFITKIEQNSFDMRQALASKYKKINNDIVILSIDDAAFELITNEYGNWPISRRIWAETIEILENANPKAIVFDLLFIKPNLNDAESDKALINTASKYDNIYFSMNFDNYTEDIRIPPKLSPRLKLKVKSGVLHDNEFITFSNARMVMEELSFATKKLGGINITRDNDGVIRRFTPIFKYKDDYYPNLSLKVAMDLLKINSIKIDNNNIILSDKYKIPYDETNRAILNWYGNSNIHKHVSYKDFLLAQVEQNTDFFKENFKDKIVYIGTTAASLADIKSSPISSQIAGVDLHATFLNNILDNNFIKKTSLKTDFIITMILAFIIGFYVLSNESVVKSFMALFLILIFYGIYSFIIMLTANLWVSVVFPYLTVVSTFVLIYCEKYLLKSKDYEETYKLAVTDGLTQLYNHRFFQEQMYMNIKNFRRYNAIFSIVMIDIDFFKKFNDTYGHQSGDCVLKQVAKILKKTSRSTDLACRYGGEEMVVILNNTNKKEAVLTAQKICQTVRKTPFILANGEKANVTISVGVATVGANGIRANDLIAYADKCLYKAKENGRNQVVYKV